MAKIKVKLLNPECEPARTHRWDAGWDLKTTERITIPKGKMVKVHTGVIMEIPARHCGLIVPRSSMGTKHRVTLANDVGIIDSEYRGEIMVFLTNDGDHDLVIEQYDRFAQLVILQTNQSELWIVDQVSKTDRGDGGFGSTDIPPKFDHADDALYLLEEKIPESSRGKPLIELSVSEYMKLKNTGMLFEIYPEATGNMKEDLKL